MEQEFAALDRLNLRDHGDAREREIWSDVGVYLSNYELFWRALIVLLTNRIVPGIPAAAPEWIRLRAEIPCEYERLAMDNYSLIYFAAAARRAIEDDRQRLASGHYPHPERVFSALQTAVENAKELQNRARNILLNLGIRHKFPKHPEDDVYEVIRLYRDAFTHDPMLGRAAVGHGRELLPPPTRLREARKNGKPLLWRDTAVIPAAEMVDGVMLADRLWSALGQFLEEQWASLAAAFMRARKIPKFRVDLGLIRLLPVRCALSTLSHTGTVAASGARSSDVFVSTG